MASKLETGYECNFVSEPDDALKCLICLAVARDPWQHGECGRLFCKNCLNGLLHQTPCPNCRTEQPTYFKDNRSKLKPAPINQPLSYHWLPAGICSADPQPQPFVSVVNLR